MIVFLYLTPSCVFVSYFQQSKFTSFQRQLNLYGFRRIGSERDKGGYYHDLFLRGRLDLSYDIKIVQNPKQSRKKTKKAPIPNFYEMPFLPEKIEPNISHMTAGIYNDKASQYIVMQASKLCTLSNIAKSLGEFKDQSYFQFALKNLSLASQCTTISPFIGLQQQQNSLPLSQKQLVASYNRLRLGFSGVIPSNPFPLSVHSPVQEDICALDAISCPSSQTFLNSKILADLMKVKNS
jgi:HSF-type DNA-binding